jgi:hypothetical protein
LCGAFILGVALVGCQRPEALSDTFQGQRFPQPEIIVVPEGNTVHQYTRQIAANNPHGLWFRNVKAGTTLEISARGQASFSQSGKHQPSKRRDAFGKDPGAAHHARQEGGVSSYVSRKRMEFTIPVVVAKRIVG